MKKPIPMIFTLRFVERVNRYLCALTFLTSPALFHTCCCYAADTLKPALILETVPYFLSPGMDLLAAGYLSKGDTCTVSTVEIDSSGRPWFALLNTHGTVWIRAEKAAYIDTTQKNASNLSLHSDDDKKRRLKILRDNQQWPHRIKMTVRDGRICLGMNGVQVRASWGEPFQTSVAFTLGVGEHVVWFFKNPTGGTITVSLRGDAVIGWLIDS